MFQTYRTGSSRETFGITSASSDCVITTELRSIKNIHKNFALSECIARGEQAKNGVAPSNIAVLAKDTFKRKFSQNWNY